MDTVHRKETRSTIDQRLRPPWTLPVNQASGGPRLRHGSATACHVSEPARPKSNAIQAHQSPVEAQPG